MNLLERLLFSVRWRTRPGLPTLRRDEKAERDRYRYGYAIARDGVSPVLIVLMAVAAIALGGFLGSRTATTHSAAPTPDLLSTSAPTTTADARLRAVFVRLSSARLEGRHELARATSPSAQAAAAQALRGAYLRAAAALGGDEKPVVALSRTAAAYAALAVAAQAGDAKAFANAATAAERAERDLERLVGARL